MTMEDIQTTTSWLDEDGKRQFDRASYASEADSWLKQAVKAFPSTVDAGKLGHEEARRRLHDPAELLHYLAGVMRERGRPVVLLPGDLETLAELIDPFSDRLDPLTLKCQKTGRKGRDFRKLAIDWAHLWRKARREGFPTRGLAGKIDDELANMGDYTTDAEHEGQTIGIDAVLEAKRRFRKFIDRIKADPESNPFPTPEEVPDF